MKLYVVLASLAVLAFASPSFAAANTLPKKPVAPITATCAPKSSPTLSSKNLLLVPIKCFARVKQANGTFKSVPVLGHVDKIVVVSMQDADKNPCATKLTLPNTGRVTVQPPGPASMVVDITVTPRNKKFRQVGLKVYRRAVKIMPSAVKASCGTPKTVKPISPPPAVLCAELVASAPNTGCGNAPTLGDGSPAPKGCVWSLSPFISTVIHFSGYGQLACPPGACWPRLGGVFTWLGSQVQIMQDLYCLDNTAVEVVMWGVYLTSPNGDTCGPVIPPNASNIAGFYFPPNWGGTMKTRWYNLVAGPQGQDFGGSTWAVEAQLTGKDDGCPELLASGRLIS